jgi:2-methylcitrate dehydratase PrpD
MVEIRDQEIDDSAFSHPSSTILPVVSALGEQLQLSGSDVLGGLLVAYEVFGSISLSCNQDRYNYTTVQLHYS